MLVFYRSYITLVKTQKWCPHFNSQSIRLPEQTLDVMCVKREKLSLCERTIPSRSKKTGKTIKMYVGNNFNQLKLNGWSWGNSYWQKWSQNGQEEIVKEIRLAVLDIFLKRRQDRSESFSSGKKCVQKLSKKNPNCSAPHHNTFLMISWPNKP